jgi:hypothetical protein
MYSDVLKRGYDVSEKELEEAREKAKDIVNKYCKGKVIVAELYRNTSFGRLIAFCIKGAKSKPELKKGYQFSYVVSLDHSDCSEMGDIYVEINHEGNPIRTA